MKDPVELAAEITIASIGNPAAGYTSPAQVAETLETVYKKIEELRKDSQKQRPNGPVDIR